MTDARQYELLEPRRPDPPVVQQVCAGQNHREADQTDAPFRSLSGAKLGIQDRSVSQATESKHEAGNEQVYPANGDEREAGRTTVVRGVSVHASRYGLAEQTFLDVRLSTWSMDRQQIISLVLVFLMLGSSIAYAATII
jgi:hypothetical protein